MDKHTQSSESEADRAKRRFDRLEKSGLLTADWDETLFLHFAVDPRVLQLPPALELELYDGAACVSLVAVTMRRFRPVRWFSAGAPFRLLPPRSFLNFRTYARWGDEPGAFFLHGWLSRPFGLSGPLKTFRLPASFARFEPESKGASRVACVRGQKGTVRFAGTIGPAALAPCRPGSLDQFALERYTGFFCRGRRLKVFRVWHPEWVQAPLEVAMTDRSLVTARFPWFQEAKLLAANVGRGISGVKLGAPHRAERLKRARFRGHRLSSFYEMP